MTLRARFPNPQGLLLPGMFVRARFTQAIDARTPSWSRSRRSSAILGGDGLRVSSGRGNKAERRTVTATRTFGANWLVTAGLNAGDKVITEGPESEAGAPIRPVPASAPQNVVPGKPGEAARRAAARPRRLGLMSRIFIDRPIFAWVIAIVIMLAGARRASASLPVEQYPDIAPPPVNIRATYPGASAETRREQRHPGHRAAAHRASTA